MLSCTQCQSALKQTWSYCPSCGETIQERRNDILETFFSEVYRQLEQEEASLQKEKALTRECIARCKEGLQTQHQANQWARTPTHSCTRCGPDCKNSRRTIDGSCFLHNPRHGNPFNPSIESSLHCFVLVQ